MNSSQDKYSELCPDAEAVQKFLPLATSNWRQLLSNIEIVVEISAINNVGGRYQKSFPLVDGWEKEAVEWAVKENVSGTNLYWVPQPKSQEAKDRVAKDDDIFCLMNVFIDRDDEERIELSKFDAEPALIVHTGSTPHERDHVYYQLSEPAHDPTAWTAVQKALVRMGNGDANCTNPARLMRLPGTISWPTQRKLERGYIAELVTWAEVSQSALSLREYAEIFGVEEGDFISSPAHASKFTADQQMFKSAARKAKLDRKIIDQLKSCRNTLPKISYSIWRNICFGTLDKYRGTSLEEEARQAFFNFSDKWEFGVTRYADIEKLWNSEDDDRSNRVTAASAIFHLNQLPPRMRPASPTLELENAASSIPSADEIELTGLAGRFHSLLVEASDRKPGNLQVGGALVALSALIGPAATISNGVLGKCCTNLYVLSLATTAFGKETIRTLTSTVLNVAGRGEEIFDGSPSDISFHAALASKGGRLTLMIDEAGILAKAMKSQSQSWQRLLISLLMRLYGLGLTRLAARQYKDKKNNIDAVEKPKPTLLLTSTVNDFTEGTSQEDSSSGFFNRLVTFVDTELPPLKDRTDLPDIQAVINLPEDVAEAVRRMAGSYIGPNLANRLPSISVRITQEAQEKLLDLKFDKVEKKLKSGGLEAETWGRAVENTQRIAGLLAVSDALVDPECMIGAARDSAQSDHTSEWCKSRKPEADASTATKVHEVECNVKHVDTAITIMMRGLHQLEEIVRTAGQQKSNVEKMKNRVLELLKKRDGKVARNDITRSALRAINSDQRQQLLDAMVEDGEIIHIPGSSEDNSGPKPDQYALPNSSQH